SSYPPTQGVRYSPPARSRRELGLASSSVMTKSRARADEILFQRSTGHRCQLAHDAVGGLARDRQLALALEFLDRGLSVGVDDAAGLDLAIAVFGEGPLQRDHTFRSRRPLDDTIVANRRRTGRGCSSSGRLRQLGGRSHDGLQQRLVRLGARFETGGLLEVS